MRLSVCFQLIITVTRRVTTTSTTKILITIIRLTNTTTTYMIIKTFRFSMLPSILLNPEWSIFNMDCTFFFFFIKLCWNVFLMFIYYYDTCMILYCMRCIRVFAIRCKYYVVCYSKKHNKVIYFFIKKKKIDCDYIRSI